MVNDTDLAEEVAALRKEIAKLNGQRFLTHQRSFLRFFGWNLIRGLAVGLGSVLGATVLLALLVSFLSSIDFIPIIGDMATRVLEEIQVDPK